MGDTDVKIIWKWIIKIQGVKMRTRFIWLRTVGLCAHQHIVANCNHSFQYISFVVMNVTLSLHSSWKDLMNWDWMDMANKKSCPAGNQTLVIQPLPSHYTNWAIPTPSYQYRKFKVILSITYRNILCHMQLITPNIKRKQHIHFYL
jgi:hypothetical protein